ncbi:MAG TPA: hypothetical protein VFU15_00815 [Bacteroidia bacterium]|nr:hypothetical protein [Bacteroidia bacterium]
MDTGNTQNTGNTEREDRIKRIWTIVSGLYSAGVIGIIAYWMFTESGPPQDICEMQANWFSDHKCYIALNFGLPLIVMMIPLLVARFFIERSTGVKLPMGRNRYR